MSELRLKEVPRFECLQEAAELIPTMDVLATEAFLNLKHADYKVSRLMNRHFDRYGITQGRFLILALLFFGMEDKDNPEAERPATPAELADAAQVTRATVTGILDSLEKDAYVRRVPDALDRRKVIIELTDAGRAFMQTLLPDHFRIIRDTFKQFTEKESRLFVTMLKKLADACDSVNPISQD